MVLIDYSILVYISILYYNEQNMNTRGFPLFDQVYGVYVVKSGTLQRRILWECSLKAWTTAQKGPSKAHTLHLKLKQTKLGSKRLIEEIET